MRIRLNKIHFCVCNIRIKIDQLLHDGMNGDNAQNRIRSNDSKIAFNEVVPNA